MASGLPSGPIVATQENVVPKSIPIVGSSINKFVEYAKDLYHNRSDYMICRNLSKHEFEHLSKRYV